MGAPVVPAQFAVVPAEFVGKAREIRRRAWLADERINRALPRILTPLELRLQRKTTIRQWQYQAALKNWDAVAADEFRMRREAKFEKGRFGIVEARLGASKWTGANWEADEFEPALVVLVTSFRSHPLEVVPRPIATINLHALARRIQRGRDRRFEAILLDIACLVSSIGSGTERFRVPGGEWRGVELQRCLNVSRNVFQPIMSIRTFIDNDTLEARAARRPAA